MIESDAASQPKDTTADRKVSRRTRFNQIMRLARRVHLYAGLFMLPWVFLYGITALLFNHPDAFPDAVARRFPLSGTPLGQLPSAEALAAEVVKALDDPAYRLVRPDRASFSRELAATAQSDGRQYNIRIDLEAGEGTAREVANRPKLEPAPFASRGPTPPARTPPLADLKEALSSALAKVGLPAGEVTVRTTPELNFWVEGGGRTWRAQYDLSTGALSGRPEDTAGDPLSPRRFLTRLHLAHGYPSRLGPRWAWAVAVDLMFASMVGWGITGLLMWWQIKSVRRIGIIVLALSALVAGTLAVGMHEALTEANSATRAEAVGPEKSAGRRPSKSESPASEGSPRRTP